MTFNKCSINFKLYGELYDEYSGEPIEITHENSDMYGEQKLGGFFNI